MKYTKRILAFVLALVLCITLIPMTNASAKAKTRLNKKKATVYIGKSIKLQVKNKPAGKKVKWQSTDRKVATVKKGKVKAKRAGKATIVAKIGKKSYRCKLTVKKKKNNVNPLPEETTNSSKPEKPSNSVKPTEPDETTTPSQHEHNWSSGWLDTEIAKDESGNKVSLHLCAKCYEYFGSTSGDEWIGRFWDHCDTVHEAGYTTWPLYAYYDAEWCSGCDTMKRGKFAFYGYRDYSVSNQVSTRKLEPWQVKELNLPLK